MPGNDILVTRDDPPIAVVTLNRPHRRNATTLAMWRDLEGLFAKLGKDGSVRAVILTGSGGCFSGGGDVSEFNRVRGNAEQAAAYVAAVERCVAALSECPVPTIAAIAGYCLGGGCSLAQGCDFRIADASARFGIPVAKLGAVYNRRDCQNLLSLVGLAKAKEILFTGEQMDAREAARIGLVDRLAEGDALVAAKAFARTMIDSAPLTIAGCKLILNVLAAGEGDKRQDEIEAALGRSGESEDYREGIRAFAEKRQPVFKGR